MNITTIGKSFPNLRARIASYDPASQFVNFETFTQERFEEIISKPLEVGNEKGFGIIMHEFRHAIDHLATLWGQHHLLKLQKALSARLSGKAEEFHHVIPYKKEENQLFHVDFYSEGYNKTTYTGPDSRWKYRMSIGLRFTSEGQVDDSKPILFAKFSTADDKPLIRVPLTVASLLETNAMYEEHTFILNAYKEQYKDDYLFHIKMYSDEFLKDLLYNQNLAVYNVAVHTVANSLNISDVTLAYRISSAIATVALNMPTKLSEKIPIPEQFTGEELVRSKALLHNNDRGFIFYALCLNYSKKYVSGDFNLSVFLKANLLPEEVTFRKEVSYEFMRIQHEMSKQKRFYPRFSIYNNIGFNMFVVGGIDGLSESLWVQLKETKYRPPLAFEGGEGIDTYNDALKRLALSDDFVGDNSLWFNVVHDVNRMMDEFYTVRGL
jgi:hypothetical protein